MNSLLPKLAPSTQSVVLLILLQDPRQQNKQDGFLMITYYMRISRKHWSGLLDHHPLCLGKECDEQLSRVFWQSVIIMQNWIYTPSHHLLVVNAVLNRVRRVKSHTPALAHTKTKSVCTRLQTASACVGHCQVEAKRSTEFTTSTIESSTSCCFLVKCQCHQYNKVQAGFVYLSVCLQCHYPYT